MRCDNCTHWMLDEREEHPDVRRCSKALELWEATEWDENYDRVPKKGIEEQMMFVMDGSSYSATLYTKAEFFCAHHTIK